MEKGETAPSEGAAKRWRHDTQLARKCFQDSQRFDDVLRQHDGERISFDVAVEIARMAPVYPSQDSPLIDFKEWLKGQLLMLVEASDDEVPDGGVLVVTQKFVIHVGYAEYVIGTLVNAFQAERSDGPPILTSSERANWLREGLKRRIRDATDDDGCLDVTVSVPLRYVPIQGVESFNWMVEQCKRVAQRHCPDLLLTGVHLESTCVEKPKPEPDSLPVVLAPVEGAIRECIDESHKSSIYWDVLSGTARILHQCQQPPGEALQDWLVNRPERPDGRSGRSRRRIKNAPRNRAIISVIEALVSRGMTETRSDASPPHSACDAVAAAFHMRYETVATVWKNRPRLASS